MERCVSDEDCRAAFGKVFQERREAYAHRTRWVSDELRKMAEPDQYGRASDRTSNGQENPHVQE